MVGVGLALGLCTVSVEVQKSGVGSFPCLEARPLDGIPVPAEHGVCAGASSGAAVRLVCCNPGSRSSRGHCKGVCENHKDLLVDSREK